MTASSVLAQGLLALGAAQTGDGVMGHPRNYFINYKIFEKKMLLTRLGLLSHHG